MTPINLTEEFKEIIAQFVNKCDTRRVDHILYSIINQGWIDEEYAHLIFSEDGEYNSKMDLIVLDAVEDEIKRQLLIKYNENEEN